MIREHLRFALKLAVGLIVVFAVVDLLAQFSGINLRPYLLSPLTALGFTKSPATTAGG